MKVLALRGDWTIYAAQRSRLAVHVSSRLDVVATVSVPTNEGDFVVSPDGTNAYVTAIFANVISVLPLPVA